MLICRGTSTRRSRQRCHVALATVLVATLVCGVSASPAFAQMQPPAPSQAQPPASAQQPPTVAPPAPPPEAPRTQAPPAPVPRSRSFQTVTIDPGHGGADSGARGSSGTVEKDFTLAWAKRLRAELQSRLHLTVLLTRDRDASPTLEERAAMANASRSDLFVSLHVSTVGKPRTARVYTWRPSQDESQANLRGRFLSWEAAQLRSREDSERFAELFESQLERLLPGSAAKPAAAPVRVLGSVAGPAVAIEVSSVSAEARQLAGIEQALAAAIVAAIQSFKPAYERAAVSNQPKPTAAEGVARGQPAREKNEVTRPQEEKPQAGKP